MLRSRLVVVLALVPLSSALAACGGSSSSGGGDKDAITSLINNVSKSPRTLCGSSVSTDNFFAGAGTTRADCVTASATQKPSTSTVDSVTVTGGTATAHVSDANGKTVLSFVKQGGTWKVDGQKAG